MPKVRESRLKMSVFSVVNMVTGKYIQCVCLVLLFPVDHDTHKFFCRLQSNVFDAASLFQTNHVVH